MQQSASGRSFCARARFLGCTYLEVLQRQPKQPTGTASGRNGQQMEHGPAGMRAAADLYVDLHGCHRKRTLVARTAPPTTRWNFPETCGRATACNFNLALLLLRSFQDTALRSFASAPWPAPCKCVLTQTTRARRQACRHVNSMDNICA